MSVKLKRKHDGRSRLPYIMIFPVQCKNVGRKHLIVPFNLLENAVCDAKSEGLVHSPTSLPMDLWLSVHSVLTIVTEAVLV